MNKKGFVTSALLYGILSLFLILILGTVAIIGNRKITNDKVKQSALDDVQSLTTDESCFTTMPNDGDNLTITDYNEITISMAPHKTTENLAVTGAFTVSIATEDTIVACDYVGIVSGKDVPDKFAKAGFHATKSEKVNAPLIDELPMALECKVKSYEDEILVGEIVNVTADESVLTNGKIDPKKLKPIAYDSANHAYLSLGNVVGKAFSDGSQLK